MANWTIVVWAAVTSDLTAAIEGDLREVGLAIGAIDPTEADIELHVAYTKDSKSAVKALKLPAPIDLGEVATGTKLGEALLRTRWNDDDRNRLLVLWGHGALGLPDEKDHAVPSAREVVKAFTGRSPGRPKAPHIIGYDACRMASAPTVLTLARTLTDAVFIGSMIPEPASGWPYSELMRILSTTSDPKAAAAAIVQAYAASVDVPDWCLIALELGKVGNNSKATTPGSTRQAQNDGDLVKALRDLGNLSAPSDADFFAAASGADTLDDTDLVDLGALMRRLTVPTGDPIADKALAAATDAVREALRKATVATRASGSLAGRAGISVHVKLPPLRASSASSKIQGPSTPGSTAGTDWAKYLEAGLFH